MNPLNSGTPGTATIIGLIIGCILGWGIRTHTNDHRYIRALAERHEAEASFYNKQYATLYPQDKTKPERKTTNGTKKN